MLGYKTIGKGKRLILFVHELMGIAEIMNLY